MPRRLPDPGATAALRLGVGGAVLAFVVLASVWLYQPTYRPTDEPSHVAYARELSHGRLPTIDTPMSGDGDPGLARVLRSRDAVHRTIWTANHPPLYYALAAVPLRIAEAAARRLAWAVVWAGAVGAAVVAGPAGCTAGPAGPRRPPIPGGPSRSPAACSCWPCWSSPWPSS
jgi:hypothetical protein